RRQIFGGSSRVKAIEGNKLVPGLLDRYLGHTLYEAQQTGEAEDPGRPNNLWQPVEGDRGAHGAFDSRAVETSGELWVAMHRPSAGQMAAGAAAVAGAAAWAWWRRRAA